MDMDRNLYQNDVVFSALALQDADFNKHLKANGQLDFSNPEAVKQLTKSLLKRDFGLVVELPDNRLCPPVPNRFNYVRWVQDLLDTTSDSYADRYIPDREVVGLDIGTGASCIYPLLGCAARRAWRFAATDIDDVNLEYAKRNIVANHLRSRVRPLKTDPKDPLIPLDTLGIESIDFTICNPPFYASSSDLLSSAAKKSRPPNSACTGAEIEMVTAGGEVAFVTRMIQESDALKNRVQWYTSMLGKLSSVSEVIEQLKKRGVDNWAVTEFVQGTRTRRWGVAWSWGDMRPRMDVARGIYHLPKHLLPFPSETSFSIPKSTIDTVAGRVNDTVQPLDVQWQYRPQISTGIGFAKENVWSRSARRRKQQQGTAFSSKKPTSEDTMGESSDEDDEPEPALGFKLEIRQDEEADNMEVRCRWLKGGDHVLFESFCGMLKRQITSS
ncbi:hypothetical protein MMC15_002168 [Xylographa vitiligo]|nr:hypothetical protein [Xylographa vitiligo]